MERNHSKWTKNKSALTMRISRAKKIHSKVQSANEWIVTDLIYLIPKSILNFSVSGYHFDVLRLFHRFCTYSLSLAKMFSVENPCRGIYFLQMSALNLKHCSKHRSYFECEFQSTPFEYITHWINDPGLFWPTFTWPIDNLCNEWMR